jgi:GntR family transcriptional regulator, transcriptional repressor for pyruvate dehydrogenase complex
MVHRSDQLRNEEGIVAAVRLSSSSVDGGGGTDGTASVATAVLTQPDDRHLGAFRPIRIQKAADVVIAVLADAIRGGLYGPGDLLPNERSLAAQLQVSRNVLREAIDVLRREGILSAKRGPSGGVMVVSTERLHEVVASLKGETHDLMRCALEVRRSLEPAAFLFAAERATDEELETLEPLVEGLEQVADDIDAFYALDQRFHRDVVRLARNPLLTDLYAATLAQMAEIRDQFPILQVGPDEALRNQRTMYAALQSRDSKRIEPAVDEHLRATEVVYLGQPLVAERP